MVKDFDVAAAPLRGTAQAEPVIGPVHTDASVPSARELAQPALPELGGDGVDAKVVPAAPADATPKPLNLELPRSRAGGVASGVSLPASLLNDRGVGNVSGSALWQDLPMARDNRASLRNPALDSSRQVADPNTVLNRGVSASAHPDIVRIVSTSEGAPRTAEVVAAKLAELYGSFTAGNSAANRAAIISNLLWIGQSSTGIRYDHARAGVVSTDTYPPNKTLTLRAGVCRDTHIALSAILASLMNAKGSGTQVSPGSPNGQEHRVQTIAFNNPTEFHAYTAYQDPATGRWNAIEYGKHYDVQAGNALDAFRNLPGYISGYERWTLRGWDGYPKVDDRGVVGAAAANAFMEADPGVGTAGAFGLKVGPTELGGSYHFNSHLALVGTLNPQKLGNGLEAGLKLNYHKDLEGVGDQARGYYRAAVGAYTDFFDASQRTGQRGAADRARYQVVVAALQFDGRLETEKYQLLDAHLAARFGVDWNTRLGLPFAFGPGATGFMPAATADYSRADVGADAALGGKEQLNPQLELDWSVRLRAQADLINVGMEAITSQTGSVSRSLGKDPWQADFALALTHRADSGRVTRFEVGGMQQLAAPHDRETTASGTHYLALMVSPSSGNVNVGFLASGKTLDRKFIPVDAVGVAVRYTPKPNFTLGASAQVVAPNGSFHNVNKQFAISANFAF